MDKVNIYDDFKQPLIDFVERAEEIPNLIGVILFGSAITGDVSKKSDIDLLLVTKSPSNPEIGKESEIAHSIASEISKKFSLEHSFSITFYNLNQKDVEPDFLWEVEKEGIVIWAKPELILNIDLDKTLKPKIICSYSLKGLKEKDRRAIIRKLYESKSNLIKEKEKIAPGVFIIDAKKEPLIENLFKKFYLKDYSIKKIWIS
ncbi:nucleotidyltransferase domain-containing protein [candidate division WOR-3 bacterium]|nr:nucleotidyltransferase domain-containing protein [candidate division WOR-3 bacterium]